MNNFEKAQALIEELLEENSNLKDEEPQFFTNSIASILNESFNDMGWNLQKNKSKITAMWSIINPKNSSNHRHIHPNCFLSAAYYVKAPKNSGNIEFYEPNEAKAMRYPEVEKYSFHNSLFCFCSIVNVC